MTTAPNTDFTAPLWLQTLGELGGLALLIACLSVYGLLIALVVSP